MTTLGCLISKSSYILIFCFIFISVIQFASAISYWNNSFYWKLRQTIHLVWGPYLDYPKCQPRSSCSYCIYSVFLYILKVSFSLFILISFKGLTQLDFLLFSFYPNTSWPQRWFLGCSVLFSIPYSSPLISNILFVYSFS